MIRVSRSSIIDAPIDRVWEVLRDFNSHIDWHPAIAESEIENGEPSDQVGCVRAFRLKDGNVLREQLIALSDEECISTYCILDSTIPLKRYVASIRLKPVTDGARTYWHWESTFDAPPGRERELAEQVGSGVYEAGFKAMASYLGGKGRTSRVGKNGSAGTEQRESWSVVLDRHGGPDVLRLVKTQAPPPAAGQVRLRQSAIGVNYIDVYIRSGQYAQLIELPGAPGMEAVGVITDVGAGVTDLVVGDRVAYACVPTGAYTSVRTMDSAQLIRLPDDIADEDAAAIMFKGMTAEYLLHRTHQVKAGETVLVHAAAGGVGLLLCQWASKLGATVIGTVSNENKARLARDHGCAHVIVTGDYRFADDVMRITRGQGANVIYDGLGRAAFDQNFTALALCGHWISYGEASGAHDPVALAKLSEKSVTLSRPVLFHYTADPQNLRSMAAHVFDALRKGVIRPLVGARYPLGSAAEAHRALESRATTGSLILIP
ncbi:MAG: hypothetical protein JWQ23_296 [Herminiimonas sp.]|nr:hypothetical protein [Herminiimonas sp.]